MAEQATLFGPYLLLQTLGKGGTGQVFLARPRDTGWGIPSPVVIKKLHDELASDESFVRRFRHEAEIATAIDSPHVAKVYDVGRVGEALYMAVEYIPGWPLSRVNREVRAASKLLRIPWAVGVASAMLEGLDALHRATDRAGVALGIVHRDIAPKNVMVGRDGMARLIDLGLGKSRLKDWKTAAGVVMGSLGYMPPEQVSGREVDQRGDLYAAAVVLWEMLTGLRYIEKAPMPEMLRASAHPHYRSACELRPDLPARFDEVLRRALEPAPERRYQSAREMVQALSGTVSAVIDQHTVRTAVGERLWTELEEDQTRLRTRLAQVLPGEPRVGEPPAEPTVVYARAPGLGAPAELGRDTPSPRSASEVRVEPVLSEHEPASFTPILLRTSTGTATAQRRARAANPSRWLIPALVAALPVTLVLGMLVERWRSGERTVQVVQDVAASRGIEAEESPRVVPRPKQPSTEPRSSAAQSAPPREEPAREEPRRPRERRSEVVHSAEPASPPTPAEGAEAWVQRLTKRGWALSRRLAEGTPERAGAEAVVDELVRLGASPRLDEERARLLSLERRLGELEEKAQRSQ